MSDIHHAKRILDEILYDADKSEFYKHI